MSPSTFAYDEHPDDDWGVEKGEFQEFAGSSDCVQTVVSLGKFLDNFLENPPADMVGRLVDDQRIAWQDVRFVVNEACERLQGASEEVLFEAGLAGRAGAAKFRQWRNAVSSFLHLKNSRRGARALQVGSNILGSVASVTGVGEPMKEAYDAIKYIADLAVEESGR